MNKCVTLTGALGLVGSEFLRRLITWDPQLKIYLLCRSKNQHTPLQRLQHLLPDFPKDRIQLFETSLDQPQLGLKANEYEELVKNTTDLFHFASTVQFDLPLETARILNVQSTEQLLNLALDCQKKGNFKHFHYLSTYATAYTDQPTLALEIPSTLDRTFRNTYEQTKVEAEQLLNQKSNQLPMSIYRPSIICGDSRTGWTSKFDVFYTPLKIIFEKLEDYPTGFFIPSQGKLDIVPLDFVTDSIYVLWKKASSHPGLSIYHLTSGQNTLPLFEAIRTGANNFPEIKKLIVPILELNEEKLLDLLKTQSNRSALLSEVLKNLAPYLFDPCIYDHTDLLKKLENTSLRPTPILTIIPKLLEFCFQSQWGKIHLPRPPLGAPPIYSYDTEPIVVLGAHSISLQSAAFHFDPTRFRIPPKTALVMDVLQKATLIATQSVLQQAGYTTVPVPLALKTGMILGYGSEQITLDSLLTQRLAWKVYRNQHSDVDSKKLDILEKELIGNTPDLQEDALAGSLPNVALGQVMSFFDLHGSTYVLSAEKFAHLLILDHALEHLQTRECSMMIVGALDSEHSILEVLILKPLTLALKDQDSIQGQIPGDLLSAPSISATQHSSLLSLIKPYAHADQEQSVPLEELHNDFYEPIAITYANSILPGAEQPNSLWPLLLSGDHPTQEVIHNPNINNHDLFYSPTSDLIPNQTYSVKAALLTPSESCPITLDPIHHQFSSAFFQCKNALDLNLELSRTEMILGESKSGSYINWNYTSEQLIERIQNNPTKKQPYPHFSRHLAQLVRAHFFKEPDSPHSPEVHRPLAYSIDAACASSLAALAVAVRRLRLHKIDQALSGGVGVSVSLANLIPFAQCHALAKQKSEPFDQNSDGITLGEGVVTFILKRLNDAKRNHDSILGCLIGIGSSSDGKGKSMMAPSTEGQALAIHRAFEQTGHPKRPWNQLIQFVECHATGTPTGDASEVAALSKIYLTSERSDLLRIGSIKSQIGHTIGAAGSAGLHKILVGFEKKSYPPQPFLTHSPQTHTNQIPMPSQLHIQRTPEAWPLHPGESQRFAGVSAFGFGGTNWHAIVTSPTETNIQHRSPYKKSGAPAGTVANPKNIPRMAFLFPGHGAPYPNMGLAFYQHFPIFRSVFRIANEILAPVIPNFSIEAAIFSDLTPLPQIQENLKRPDLVQPILLTVSMAFYQLIRELGLKPSVVLGHSVGEFSAAVANGIISFEEALLAIYKRGKIYRDAQIKHIDTGSMAAVFSSQSELRKILPPSLQIAAFNAPFQQVISGPTPQLLAFVESLATHSISAKILDISVAWHSQLADQLGHHFAQDAFSKLTITEPQIPLLSSVSATYYATQSSPKYSQDHSHANSLPTQFVQQLVRQLGAPTLWSACLERLKQDQIHTCIDLGPGKILSSLVSQSNSNLCCFTVDSLANSTAEGLRHFVQTLSHPKSQFQLPPQKSKKTPPPSRTLPISPESISLLLNIAADKTGYKPEQLSLDAHLEADLGIDSIKQIQILSEFKKKWGTHTVLGSSTLGFQLRDFPTFRHWLQLVHTTTATTETSQTHTERLSPSFFLERFMAYEIPEEQVRPSSISSQTIPITASLAEYQIGIIQDSLGVAKHLQIQFEKYHIQTTLLDLPLTDPDLTHFQEPLPFQTILYLKPLGEFDDEAHTHDRSIFRLLPFLQRQQSTLKNFIAIRALRSEELGIDGALSGFVRTLFHEWTQCNTQLILTSRQLAQKNPEIIAQWLAQEILKVLSHSPSLGDISVSKAPHRLTEIVLSPHPDSTLSPLRSQIIYQNNANWQNNANRIPIGITLTSLHNKQGDLKPKFLKKNALLLLTGGLGGIVVPILKQLLRFFSPTLLILGRTPVDEIQVQKQLIALRLLHPKKKVHYLQWDLAAKHSSVEIISDQLQQQIQKNFGPLTGIIHAAGILEDQKFEQKSIDSFQKVYDVKVQGMRVLSQLALKTKVEFFCVFSSIAAEYGNSEQIDYASGNAAMTAMLTALQKKKPTLKCLSIAWGPWAQVGMAAQESVSALISLAGSGMITPTEGSIAFLNEVLHVASHRLTEPHCVIIQPSVIQPAPLHSSPILSQAARANATPAALLPQGTESYLDEILFYEPHRFLVAQKNFSLKTDPWLADHQIKNIPILPATFGIEIMTQAAMALCFDPQVKWKLARIEQFEILAPIFIPAENQIRIRATALQRYGVASTQTFDDRPARSLSNQREIWVQIEQHSQNQWNTAYQGWIILKSHLQSQMLQPLESFYSFDSLNFLDSSNSFTQIAHEPLTQKQIYHPSPNRIPLGPKFHILSGFQSLNTTSAIGHLENHSVNSKFLSYPFLREAAFHTAAFMRMHHSDELLIPRSIQSLIFYPSRIQRPTRTASIKKEKVFQIKVIDKKEEGFDSLVLDGKLCPRLEIRCLQMLDARNLF